MRRIWNNYLGVCLERTGTRKEIIFIDIPSLIPSILSTYSYPSLKGHCGEATLSSEDPNLCKEFKYCVV